MKVTRVDQVGQIPVAMEGATGVAKRVMIGPADGAPHFTMRVFDVAPGGHTPLHAHESEHEVYVIAGRGVVMEGDEEHPLEAGTFVFVPPGETHQFRAAPDEALRFICVVPKQYD
jgi:quercetin dioxygenase-like cupin family protein